MEFACFIIMNLLEIYSFILILSKVDKRIFLKGWIYKLIVVILHVTIVSICLFLNIPFKELVVGILIIGLFKFITNISFKLLIFECTISAICILIIQLSTVFLFQLLGIINNSDLLAISCNIFLLFVSIVVYKYIPINEIIPLYNRFKSIIQWLVLLITLPIGIYFISWRIDFLYSLNYVSLIVIGIITWTLIVAIVFKQLLQLKQRQKANEIYKEYNPILENLLSDVRAKQHDIKNQLNAIYGIAEKSQDQELLNYLDSIIEGYQFHSDDILLNTGNNAISAILYSKKIKAKKNNVKLDYNCYTSFPQYPVEDYEFVDIIGNLLDNAIESAIKYKSAPKKEVQVNLFNEDNNTVIEVKNTSPPVKFETLNKIFEKGYSTKGKNRGFGLYNVSKIVKSYNGNIQISYEEEQICFKILFGN
ncbi:hypothetical protein SH1V18_10120 [Vallitalea longa]|uniref:Histidine kinase domain-containing protein n=1 Tax=Vallitalea longa TaxID=2936439 RepID=A0A9W6DEJ9_9FIRM|nr:GHKL domain-containing protein [Vallitalea longa]GKX28532.1 hypothetical protein SH1V18_10120 [Vallitalea longa]